MTANGRFIITTLLALIIVGISGYLLATSDRLDLPLIHEERSHESGNLLAVNENADGEQHPEGEEPGNGEGRGAGGEGQGFRRQADSGGGRNARPRDFWTVISNLWVIGVVTLFVILTDRISDRRRKQKGAAIS